ncbi:MAG TPA: ACP S-malonyltransferase [Candidatus Acidoferrales bacterium]|nr:ACP S-malonyltransferase [Candidatus Acidoferrales bacterium]
MRIAAIFPGQGSQFVGMGGDIVEASEAAADIFARARRVLGYDLLAMTRRGPEGRLTETRFAQPAIFVTNVALYAALGERIAPVVSAGHSFGEYCSLVISEALTFEHALALVQARGVAMQEAASLARGGMAAVLGLDEAPLREVVARARAESGRVQLANFNAPGQIVVSGDADAVRRAGELAMAAGAKRVVALNVSGAWHSELMEPALQTFAPVVAAATIALPKFTVVSNVDGQPYRDVATIRANLVRSVTGEVLWHQAMLRLLGERPELIVEFGAQAVVAPLAKRLPGAPPVMHVGDSAGAAKLLSALGAPV